MLVAESWEIVCFNVETEEKTNLTQTTKYQTSGVFSRLAELYSVHMIQAAIKKFATPRSLRRIAGEKTQYTIQNAREIHFILWLYGCMRGHS